ncbi:MAG: hypothetical protein AB1714_27070 [Acidobacteriota bacterium]
MGRLSDFEKYLAGRRDALKGAEEKLCALQTKYESFFSEVARVREAELGQLDGHVRAGRAALPGWLDAALTSAEAAATKEFDQELARIQERHASLAKEAEERRRRSLELEKLVRRKNTSLDAEEEALKIRSVKLLEQIRGYNDRIRQMGRGFGFFSNLFRMRALAAERKRLDREQGDVAARIDALRTRWKETEAEGVERERELRGEWVKLESDAAAVQAKIDYLEQSRSQVIARSSLERVLFEKATMPPPPKPGDPACPRCASPNPASNHFCHICAMRLTPDRPDLEGSIDEMAQLNLHHRRFADGMKACQEIIGLVRGLKTGMDAFMESVTKMIENEKRYPLAKLQIEVPDRSMQYGRHFDQLRDAVSKDLSLHPQDFASQVAALTQNVFTADNIKLYFETMGQELSLQAKAQWG